MKPNKIVFLSPSFHPYRVPVFDNIHKSISDDFIVLALETQYSQNAKIALSMGVFPRKILKGKVINLSRNHYKGEQTPFGLVWAPKFPFILMSLKPSVVITTNFNAWTLITLLMGYPTIIVWEGTSYTERTVKRWREKLRYWMARRAKAFVVNGTLAKLYLVEKLHVPKQLIFTGGMCSELPPSEYFTKEPKKHSDGEPIRFLFCGRLIPLKGAKHLLFAAKILMERLNEKINFEIRFLGDGPDKNYLINLSEELNIQEMVFFEGAVHPDRVWEYYQKSHVFVLPTLQDNWPLVVQEAMYMHLPILLSKYAGSAPDLIKEGENGYTFDPNEHQSLANYMKQYIIHPGLIVEHGEESFKMAQSYRPEIVADVFLKALNN